jgi:hypothetical protein
MSPISAVSSDSGQTFARKRAKLAQKGRRVKLKYEFWPEPIYKTGACDADFEMRRAVDSKRSGVRCRNVQQPERFKPSSATADKASKKAEPARPKKQKAPLGNDVLDEASFNSQEPRPPPGSSKRLRQNNHDEEGGCQRQSKNARRSIAYDDDSRFDVDERSASEDEMSASEDISASEDDFVRKDSDDDDDDEDDDDDVEQIGGRKLVKGRISERQSFPSQVLSLFLLLCIF